LRARATSLAARLVLLFALGSAVIFMATGYALYHALKMRVEANESAELTGKSAAVERLLGEVQTLAELRENLDRFRDVSVGHPHLSVGLTANGRWLLPLPAEVGHAADRTWLTHRVSRELRDGVPVEAVLAIETTETHALLRDHAIVAALMAIAGTVASALLALGVVRRGLAPLAQLAGRAEQVTAERLGARLSLQEAPREVHGLADSINRMLERLEESFRALEQFSADIAHELRTPLNNLLLQTQVTLSRPRGEAEYREALHSNLEELERLQRMVLDMLFLARADRGMIEPAREDIDLRAEIESVSEYFEAAAAERSQTITVRGDGRLGADRSLLRRAMNNLLSNAVRYSPPGSAIDIAIEGTDAERRVIVTNPAEAIPEEELHRLFKRFARRDDSRGRTLEGAGLGLAIVESIMKLQGGTIRARQEGGLLRLVLAFPGRQIAIS
jgi:two-component system, OmpR family, heavy metal sensor histidine kinase CusS